MPVKDFQEIAEHFETYGECINCGSTELNLTLKRIGDQLGWKVSCKTSKCQTTWFKPVK